MIIELKSVILEQRMGNERSFMQLCGVVGDLIIVPFGSEVMVKWLGWGQNRVETVLWILYTSKKFVIS